jgi:hypothetical protein
VRAQQVELQLRRVGGRDRHGHQVAEARGDAIDGAAAAQRVLHHLPGGGDAGAVGVVERRRIGAARHRLQVGERGHGRHAISAASAEPEPPEREQADPADQDGGEQHHAQRVHGRGP